MLDACMKFQNYPIKTVGGDAFYSYYILYHYFKISKNRQKFKNSSMVKKSTSQMTDIILDACMKFQNYPIKTVGGDAFYSHYILYHYFKISKNRQKFKNSLMLKKKHKVGEWYHTWCLYEISKLSDQNCRRRCILQLLYIITLFQNFKKSPKIQKWSDRQKKAQARWVISCLMPVWNFKTIRLKL